MMQPSLPNYRQRKTSVPGQQGTVTKKKDVKKRAPKKKTAAKVTGSDDSEVEDGGTGRKVNRDTGFHVSTWYSRMLDKYCI